MTAAAADIFTKDNLLRIILSGLTLTVVVLGLVWLLKFSPRGIRPRRKRLGAAVLAVFAGVILAVVLARIWRGQADWIDRCYDWLRSNEVYINIFWTVVATAAVTLLGRIAERAMVLRCEQLEDRHRVRRGAEWIRIAALIIVVGVIWFRGVELGIFLGVVGAGLALSMQEVLLCLAGWAIIIVKRPFDIGDRIEINGNVGDVIDIRVFQTTLLEVGNWVGADQSTGRLINVPNSAVFRGMNANYTKGFPFIWNELTVTVTFESDWNRAKEIILEQAEQEAEKIEEEVRNRIENMQKHYAIRYQHLTPIVYTSIVDHGVSLTLRHICPARKRRGTSHAITEGVLRAFDGEKKISLAYPTTRFYDATRE
jgi:hypothetical protein